MWGVAFTACIVFLFFSFLIPYCNHSQSLSFVFDFCIWCRKRSLYCLHKFFFFLLSLTVWHSQNARAQRHALTQNAALQRTLCVSGAGMQQVWNFCRVGQNHTFIGIYGVYIRYFWQGNHHTYGHIRCVYMVLANPKLLTRSSRLIVKALVRIGKLGPRG